MNNTTKLIIFLFMAVLIITGCSQNNEEPEKKSSIEQFTSKTAQNMVQRIKSPIEKAQKAKETQEERNLILDKANKN